MHDLAFTSMVRLTQPKEMVFKYMCFCFIYQQASCLKRHFDKILNGVLTILLLDLGLLPGRDCTLLRQTVIFGAVSDYLYKTIVS